MRGERGGELARQWRVLAALSRPTRPEGLSTAELVAQAGGTQRTLRRDLAAFARLGIVVTPTRRGRHVYYSLHDDCPLCGKRRSAGRPAVGAVLARKIAEDYRGGVTLDEIMARYDVDQRTVYRHVRAAGINPTRSADLTVQGERAAAVVASYLDPSISVDDLLARHGISVHTLYQVLRREGIPLRGRAKRTRKRTRPPSEQAKRRKARAIAVALRARAKKGGV